MDGDQRLFGRSEEGERNCRSLRAILFSAVAGGQGTSSGSDSLTLVEGGRWGGGIGGGLSVSKLVRSTASELASSLAAEAEPGGPAGDADSWRCEPNPPCSPLARRRAPASPTSERAGYFSAYYPSYPSLPTNAGHHRAEDSYMMGERG